MPWPWPFDILRLLAGTPFTHGGVEVSSVFAEIEWGQAAGISTSTTSPSGSSSASSQQRQQILSKCNAHTYEVALLRGVAREFFAAGLSAAIQRKFDTWQCTIGGFGALPPSSALHVGLRYPNEAISKSPPFTLSKHCSWQP